MLTLMLVPGTKLYQQWQKGDFQLLEAEKMLVELQEVIGNLDGLTHCVFRTNHASNYLPLKGTFPQDKVQLLKTLDAALAKGKDALRPEAWRGL
jgi:radical SAM superfamily enzyme